MFSVNFKITDEKPQNCALRGEWDVPGKIEGQYLVITVKVFWFPICNYWILK